MVKQAVFYFSLRRILLLAPGSRPVNFLCILFAIRLVADFSYLSKIKARSLCCEVSGGRELTLQSDFLADRLIKKKVDSGRRKINKTGQNSAISFM